MNRTFLAYAGGLSLVAATAQAAPAEDAYAPLRLYQGAWSVATGEGKTVKVDNSCAKTGLFFVCEQIVNGKTAALVVFLPSERKGAAQTYRTQALRPDSTAPGHWYTLTISGDDWVYLGDVRKGKRSRTLNHFRDADHIHFEVQTSKDGKTWTTTQGGDETRGAATPAPIPAP